MDTIHDVGEQEVGLQFQGSASGLRRRAPPADVDDTNEKISEGESDSERDSGGLYGHFGPAPLRRRPPLPIKTTLAAFTLLLIGIVFGITFLVVYYRHDMSTALPFLAISAIGK